MGLRSLRFQQALLQGAGGALGPEFDAAYVYDVLRGNDGMGFARPAQRSHEFRVGFRLSTGKGGGMHGGGSRRGRMQNLQRHRATTGTTCYRVWKKYQS